MLRKISWRKVGSVISITSLLNLASGFSLEIWAKSPKEGSNQGWPTRRVGGGSRGCLPESNRCEPLMALIPDDLVSTATASPTLLFYLPQIQDPQAVKVEFVLWNQANRIVYETTFTPSGEAGIIRLTLNESKTFPGLEINQDYHWYLSIIYDNSDRSHDDVVEGWVRYVPLNSVLAQQIDRSSGLERVQLYQNANLWPEALTTLSYLKQSQPSNLNVSQKWTQMLQSVSLDVPMLTQDPFFNRSDPKLSRPFQDNYSPLSLIGFDTTFLKGQQSTPEKLR